MANAEPSAVRKYGYWTGHFVVVASMIGAGILTTSGFTLQATGNPAALIGLWVLGGLLALCGAVTVAELATAMPRSGGDYVFVREAYGRGAAFVSGWATFVIGFAAPTAVVSRLALSYLAGPFADPLTRLFGRDPGNPMDVKEVLALVVPMGATLLVLGVAIVHTLGHRQSSILQVTATIIKAAILIGIAVGGIFFGSGDWNHFNDSYWPKTTVEWAPLAVGLIYVGYAYSGWNGAAYLAGEIRNPSRLLPLCLLGGALTVIALYVLVNLAYVFALDPEIMKNKSMETQFPEVQQIAKTATDAMFGPQAANVVAVALGLSLIASVSAYVLTGPRVAFAMARDAAFPPYAGRLHPRLGTPALATWTLAMLATILIWSDQIAQFLSVQTGGAWKWSFLELLEYTAIGLGVAAGLTVASIFPIRRRTDLPHPYKMPLYPLPPLLFLGLTAWSIGYTLHKELDPWVRKVIDEGKVEMLGPATLSVLTILIAIPLAQLIPAPKRSSADGP